MAPERRYQVLVATLAQAAVEVTDEILDLFDLAVASTDSRARRALAELREYQVAPEAPPSLPGRGAPRANCAPVPATRVAMRDPTHA